MQDPPPPNLISQLGHAAGLLIVGVAIGLGQMLRSKEILTRRLVVGRALTSGGLGMAAGAALSWAPDLPLLALLGIAATLASLGTSGLERVIDRIAGRHPQ